MGGSSPGRALAATAPSFEVVFIDETGTHHREPLSACWDVPFERAKPSRSFPSFKGQKNFPGLWWSATTGEHVGYESWVERDVAMLLDFDPEIVGFSAQPFWLLWPGEQGERKHAPDFFARRTDGTGVVIDVRPDDRVDPEATEVFEVAASACREAGWEFRRTGAPPAVLTANVRWLAGYPTWSLRPRPPLWQGARPASSYESCCSHWPTSTLSATPAELASSFGPGNPTSSTGRLARRSGHCPRRCPATTCRTPTGTTAPTTA
jgi:hypothetical protein